MQDFLHKHVLQGFPIHLRQKGILPQIFPQGTVRGAIQPDNFPKGGGVVEFPQMTQFVNEHIIAQFGRQHGEPPIELYAPVRVTAPPSCLKIAERQIARGDTHAARKGMQTFRQEPPARLFEIGAHRMLIF